MIAQGATPGVLEPIGSTAAFMARSARDRGVKDIAHDRPIPDNPADLHASFGNRGIGAMAQSLVGHLKAEGIPARAGALQINGSPADAAAGLVRDGVDSAPDASGHVAPSEFGTPDRAPPGAQQRASARFTRFGDPIIGVAAANDGTSGHAIAAFKAAGMDPVPR